MEKNFLLYTYLNLKNDWTLWMYYLFKKKKLKLFYYVNNII